VSEGFQKFTEELGEAWRRGVAKSAASEGPEARSAQERADANAHKIQEAASSIMSGLKELSEKLQQAVRDASANEKLPGERAEGGGEKPHDGETNGSGRA
jgi:hypothetical protein